MPPSETIDTVLDAFLHERRLRLSEPTYRNYEAVIRLLRDSLNTYAYSSLSDADATRWRDAFVWPWWPISSPDPVRRTQP